jgi:hypothetical protein
MMYWIYDYASWVIGPLFVAIFIAVTWIGTFLTVVEFLRSVWDLARASRCRPLWIGAEVAIERGQAGGLLVNNVTGSFLASSGRVRMKWSSKPLADCSGVTLPVVSPSTWKWSCRPRMTTALSNLHSRHDPPSYDLTLAGLERVIVPRRLRRRIVRQYWLRLIVALRWRR